MTDPRTALPGQAAAQRPRVGPIELALWLGLLGGLVEAGRISWLRYVRHIVTKQSVDALWMAPIAVVIPAAVVALACALVVWRRPHLNWWKPVFTVLTFVAVLGPVQLIPGLHRYAYYALAGGVAVQAGVLAARYADGARRLVRRTLPLLVAVTAALAFAARGIPWLSERRAIGALPPTDSGAPSVLLVVLDAVRASDLSAYGYQRRTTPRLEELAARGVLFERAVAPSSWTLPSHASMFTGRDARDLSTTWRTPLDGSYPTLAEVLRRRGYLTAGFVANLQYTTRESGLQRGFMHYDENQVTPLNLVRSGILLWQLVRPVRNRRMIGPPWMKHAEDVRRDAAQWLAAHPGRPYFAFINLYDAHDPYLPPAPFDTMFAPRRTRSERNVALLNGRPVTVAQAQPERDAYDQSIAYLDREVGLLLDDLRQRGLLANTYVIVTADHGEEFGEHGLLQHGNSLYFQSLHIPLIIAGPGLPDGRRVSSVAGLRHLAATILDLTGTADTLPGRSLRAQWQQQDAVPGFSPALAEVRFASGHPSWQPISKGDMSAGVTDRLQLIIDGRGTEEVFDLVKDPGGSERSPDSGSAVSELRRQVPRSP